MLKISNASRKSTVWQKFLYLNHFENKYCIGYIICKTCKQALNHNKSTSGITHLNDHLKQCKYNAKISPKVTAYFSKSDMSLSKVIKDTVLNSSIAFVVSDVRPLSAVEGNGQGWGDYMINVIDYNYDYSPILRLRLRLLKI